MGEREGVITWTENNIVVTHFEDRLLVFDRMKNSPVGWKSRVATKTDVNLINRVFTRLKIEGFKAKLNAAGFIEMWSAKARLDQSAPEALGEYEKATTLVHFTHLPDGAEIVNYE